MGQARSTPDLESIPETPGVELARQEVRRATRADVARLAETLARAFYEDPPFVWLLPNEATRTVRLQRFFEIELQEVGLARGTVWTTDAREGAAVSTPPGRWRVPWYRQLVLIPAYARAFGDRLAHAQALLARVEARHARWPHHYFPFIGVAPERQRQGVGSDLMRPTLERCDHSGLTAYLEASSERNARLYERLGFQLVDELHYGGSDPLRLMLRLPGPPAVKLPLSEPAQP